MEIKPSVCGRKQNHQRFPIQKRTHTQPVRDSGQIRDIDGVVKLCPPVHAAYRIRHCRTTLPDSDSGLLMRRFAFAPIRHCTFAFRYGATEPPESFANRHETQTYNSWKYLGTLDSLFSTINHLWCPNDPRG